MIVGAIHRAADAVAVICAADRQVIRQAIRGQRIYFPTWRLRDGHGEPYLFRPCPPAQVARLKAIYNSAISSVNALTAALDDLAAITGAPSISLATPRRNPMPQRRQWPVAARDDTGAIEVPGAGEVGISLRRLRINEPTMLTRAEIADTGSGTAQSRAAESAVCR